MDARIVEVNDTIDALEKFWFRHPELRLGQILSNIMRIGPSPRDMWALSELDVQAGLALLEELYGPREKKPVPPGETDYGAYSSGTGMDHFS